MPSDPSYEEAYQRLKNGKETQADVDKAKRMRDLAGGEGTREGREAIAALEAYTRRTGKSY